LRDVHGYHSTRHAADTLITDTLLPASEMIFRRISLAIWDAPFHFLRAYPSINESPARGVKVISTRTKLSA
jgi:hypothetical protein